MNLTQTHYSAAAGALIGLVLWGLSYVFKSGTPAPVSAAVYILLPGIVAGAAGFLTRKDAKQPAASGTMTGQGDGHDNEGDAHAGVRPSG